jgi:hypothetical protein
MLKRQATTNPDQIFGKCPTSVDLAAVFHKEKPRKRRYSQVGSARAATGAALSCVDAMFTAHVIWALGGGPVVAGGGGGVSGCECWSTIAAAAMTRAFTARAALDVA